MKYRYKIQFESVSPFGHGGQFYTAGEPNVRPEQVPDDGWHEVSRETDALSELRAQYRQLKAWEETGEQLVRNVRLYRMSLPRWQEIDDKGLVL